MFFCSVELLQENNAEYDEELLVDLAQLNHGEAPLRMEDCDAFKCQVVSLGKKAYDVVSKFWRDWLLLLFVIKTF